MIFEPSFSGKNTHNTTILFSFDLYHGRNISDYMKFNIYYYFINFIYYLLWTDTVLLKIKNIRASKQICRYLHL